MARYTGPKVRLSRRVGVPIADIPKHTNNERIKTPAGMHGYRGRRLRDFGVRMNEKQKVRYHYGVLEKQFRRYLAEAGRQPGNTGAVLMQLLERRLDNVIYRIGFATSRAQARQLVRHGHFLINGKKVDIPSFVMRQGDLISVRQSSIENATIAHAREEVKGRGVPQWLELDSTGLAGKVAQLPTREQINLPVQEQRIVELYSK